MTEHALQHRFRRLRAQSSIIREARAQNLDMKKMERDENNLPATIDSIDKKSTPLFSFTRLFNLLYTATRFKLQV